jgi:hypothetical protein
MVRSASAGLFLVLTLVGAAPAYAKAEARVSIDWRHVSDPDVQRCGLTRVDPTGVEVRVSSVADGLRIQVQGGGKSREETLSLPESCDATLVLEVISRIAELVRDVEEAMPKAPAAKPAGGPEPARAHPFQLSLDAELKAAHPSEFVLFGGGIAGDWAVSDGFRLGGRTDLVANGRLGVTVFEASAALTVKWRPASSVIGLHFEAGPLFHLGTSDELTARELDGAAGAGPELRVGPFRAQLLGYVRFRRFEHQMDREVAFDTRNVGLILRIGAQLFDS